MNPERSEPVPAAPVSSPPRLRVVALAVQKGGTGKTTLAASLAVAAAEAGERVTAFDLDPQGSLAAWGAMRAMAGVAVERLRPWEFGQMPDILAAFADEGTTLAILDTAGSAAGIALALKGIDLVLVPVRPSRLDLVAAHPTLTTLVGLGMRHALAVVLNQCPPPPSPRTAAYATQIRSLGVLAEPNIVQRVDHQDALARGLGVTEYAPAGPAAGEIRSLWSWIDIRTRIPNGSR